MLTIFTPTYNRAYILPQLYKSLCAQTCKDFEWLIVDDGSTDNTSAIVQWWISEHIIDIRYFKQENGGKHTAINFGVREAKGDFFFIVDSDDYLTDDAVDWIQSKTYELAELSSFAGFSGIRIKPDGTNICNAEKFPVTDCFTTEFGMKLGIKGDLAEIFYTAILKELPFPVFKGEHFCPEALVWFRMADKGLKIRYFCHPIYVCSYLPDGLTSSIIKARRNSPSAMMIFYSELAHRRNIPLKFKVKAYINYWRFAVGEFSKLLGQIGVASIPFMLLGRIIRIVDKYRLQ